MALTAQTICYDLPTISRFFRSCAITIATQMTTSVHWATYRDSKVLNAVYAVFFWKEPIGFAEVHSATKAELDRKTDELHEHFLMTWVRKLGTDGPAAAQNYATQMDRQKQLASQATQSLFREVGNINAEILGQTQEVIANLALIKLGSQIGVAVLSAGVGVAFVGGGGAGLSILGLQAGATANVFTAVGAANSITHSIIKNWEKGGNAQFVGVAMESGKVAASEIGGHVAAQSIQKALAGSAKSAQIIRSAQGEIEKYAAKLAQEGLRKKAAAKATNIVANRTAQISTQKTAAAGFAQTARAATSVANAIPVVFALWDAWDAVADYKETTAANR